MRIAEYELYKKGQSTDVPVKFKTSYDEARKDLELAGRGSLCPPGALRRSTGTSIAVKSDTSLFDSDSWNGRSSSSETGV